MNIRNARGTHYPCSGAVNMARKRWCNFEHPCLRALLVTCAIPGVLQVENDYYVVISNGPSTRLLGIHCPCSRPVFTGGQKMPLYTLVNTAGQHGPSSQIVWTGAHEHGP